MSPRTAVLLALGAALTSFAPAAAPPAERLPAPAAKTVSFRSDVYPILSRCLRCHQGSNPTSGYRLDLRAELLGASDGKPLVEPRASGASRLIHVVAGHVPDRQMPPEGRGKRLTAAQVGVLRAWIDQGLAWDDKLLPPTPAPSHWAFQPVTRPAVPRPKNAAWPANPLDAFVAAGHEAKGLTPAPEAPRRVLIRRLYLDLLGLPPAPADLDAFVADKRADAYERLVDRLLASPHYGERWGRHWLDVARWAESEGYESNHLRPYAWRYRDYVVGSFNADRPFAEFVRQQVAGDEMKPYTDENLIATGFLAAARLSSNEEDKARQRNDVLVDVVNATASAFLGLTMNCAQCHNHKFDPLTARDYYAFQGFFVKGQPGNLALQDPLLWAKYKAALPAGYEAAKRESDALLKVAYERLVEERRRALTPALRTALGVPAAERTAEQERLARAADLKLQFTSRIIETGVPPGDRKRYEALKKKLAEMEKGKPPDPPQTFGYYSPATSPAKVDVLPMKGFYPLPFQLKELAGARARLLVAGDVHALGPTLLPAWPAVFGPTPASAEKAPRLALADWLTSPKNPLAARVWVNRVWQYHFGKGLVATPADFGVKGARPTHPELLDWLAAEFLATGGSTKRLHRLLVTSAAYRQASAPHAGNARIDPDNKLLWRWAPRRLEGEAIRDALLAVAGELDSTPGGQGDADERASKRRGVYLLQRREHPTGLLGVLDGPSAAAESCPRRDVSTVALQPLYLLNSGFAADRARAFAARVRAEAGADPEKQCTAAFGRALGRAPTAGERGAAKRFFARYGEEEPGEALAAFCQALLNLNEFVYLE